MKHFEEFTNGIHYLNTHVKDCRKAYLKKLDFSLIQDKDFNGIDFIKILFSNWWYVEEKIFYDNQLEEFNTFTNTIHSLLFAMDS